MTQHLRLGELPTVRNLSLLFWRLEVQDQEGTWRGKSVSIESLAKVLCPHVEERIHSPVPVYQNANPFHEGSTHIT